MAKTQKRAKKQNKKKSNSKPKSAVTAKAKKKVGVDKCNRREGTQGFLINTKINGRPKSVAQLIKETKLPKRRIVTHVCDMVRKGFLKKNKQGGYSWA